MIKQINGFDVINSTFITGERPVQYYGICGGRDEFEKDLSWDGCIDASSAIPTGRVRVVAPEWIIVPCAMRRE